MEGEPQCLCFLHGGDVGLDDGDVDRLREQLMIKGEAVQMSKVKVEYPNADRGGERESKKSTDEVEGFEGC